MIKKHGNCWNAITLTFEGRSSESVRNRFRRISDSFHWTSFEDKRLHSLVDVYGPQWSHFAEKFPDRIVSSIRNRWVRISRPNES